MKKIACNVYIAKESEPLFKARIANNVEDDFDGYHCNKTAALKFVKEYNSEHKKTQAFYVIS